MFLIFLARLKFFTNPRQHERYFVEYLFIFLISDCFFKVDVPTVMKTVRDNAVKAKSIIIKAITKIAAKDWSAVYKHNQVCKSPFIDFLELL